MLYQKLIESNLHITKPILKDTHKELSYNAIHEKAINAAYQLKMKGITEGDRVLIISDNSMECVILVLACISMGAVFIMLPNATTQKQLQFIIQDSGPKLICHALDYISTGINSVSTISYPLKDEKIEAAERKLIDKKSICYILYTSGSTKHPKGVVACQKQVLFCLDAIQSVLGNTQNDCILNVLPLSFDFGLYQIFLAFMFRSEVVLLKKYIIPQIPVYLKKYKITIFPLVPSIAALLIKTGELKKYELPYLRQINSTGDILEISVIRKWQELFPKVQILPMYGLTECKRVSIMPEEYQEKIYAGSCGKPLPGISVYLMNKDQTGAGELVVEGENVMEGYWNRPNEQTSFFYNSKTKQKALRTGDLFWIDEDGFLYFKGRIKNIIKSNGYRISNVELESELLEMEELIEVIVFGIPDKLLGEKICAAVYTMDSDAEKKIRKVCNTWPLYQRPHLLIISRKPLPQNSNGKLDKIRFIETEEQSIDYEMIKLR